MASARGGAVSLRDPASPVLFVDTKQQAAYERECDAARASQPTRFAVAPRCQVSTPDGRMFTAGQAITAADLHGASTPAWRLLEQHVRAGRVLENIKVRD